MSVHYQNSLNQHSASLNYELEALFTASGAQIRLFLYSH